MEQINKKGMHFCFSNSMLNVGCVVRRCIAFVGLMIGVLGLSGCTDNKVEIEFLSNEEAAKVLSREDDYLKQLSPFDLQFNFSATEMLNRDQLESYYTHHTKNWPTLYQKKIQTAIDLLNEKIKDLDLDYPEKIQFILSKAGRSGGAAYTRMNAIVWPESFMMMEDELFNRIVAHEFFHVYSRYHHANKPTLYAPVNYQQTGVLTLPDEIAQMRITNPDTPILNYAITLDYQGSPQTFMPVLFSKRPYDKRQPLLYNYFSNKLLAVTLENGQPSPVYRDGKPLLVDKKETNFTAVVGPNTPYLMSPEELSAENFSLWVVGDEVENEKPVKALIKAMTGLKH